MARLNIERGPGVLDLIDEMKAAPTRLDKEMRGSLRKLPQPIRDDARSRMAAAHPVAKDQRQRRGTYRWSQVVNAITSSANSDTPTVRFGDDDKGRKIGGWEFGSKGRWPQFGPWTPEGRAFFPAVRDAIPKVTEETKKVVAQYMELHFAANK